MDGKYFMLSVLNRLRLSLVIPDSWRMLRVVPIPKRNSDKFRFIALAWCICKIVERMITYRLNHWLEQKNPVPDNMFGFQYRHNVVVDCCSIFSSDVYNYLINRKYMWPHSLIYTAHVITFISPLYNRFFINSLIPKHFIQFTINLFIQSTQCSYPRQGLGIHGTTYLGLPQRLPLSPTLFNVYTSKVALINFTFSRSLLL